MFKPALFVFVLFIVLLSGCAQQNNGSVQPQDAQPNNTGGLQPASSPEPGAISLIDRESKIPADAVKVLPENDANPPKSLSADYENPVPLPYPVNTAGAEDSPFIPIDGKTLYFFFTPDVRVPVEKQILDGVTGIYVSKKENGNWSKPERIILQDSGKLAMDGCEFVLGNMMWFCSAREGYTGVHWFTADYESGKWQDWKNADFNPGYEVGELHMNKGGNELYFHSARAGGKGKLDIWLSKKVNGIWQEPENISAINTADDEGWPALSPDETELWFIRNYGTWRSKKINGAWSEPELIFSPLAGEPTLDNAGNVYFVHHYFDGNRMLEADIYIAKKK